MSRKWYKEGRIVPVKSSTKYVMDRIAGAMMKLMTQKPYQEISICEIVGEAKVSRNSFYRHFQNKDDVLRYYISSETASWLEQTDINCLNAESPQKYIVFLLEHLRTYQDSIDALLRDNKMYLLEEEFDRRFTTTLSKVADPWHIAFIVGGFYKLFCYWAKTGYEKTPQEIAAYMK